MEAVQYSDNYPSRKKCYSRQEWLDNGASVIDNADGTVSVYQIDSSGDGMQPVFLSKPCCEALGDGYTFDLEFQKCRWKQDSSCSVMTDFKVVLNPNGNDGSIFYSSSTETCALEVKFDYLLKFDCAELAQTIKNRQYIPFDQVGDQPLCDGVVDALESMELSLTIDVYDDILDTLTPVYEVPLLNIGEGNLFNYLSTTAPTGLMVGSGSPFSAVTFGIDNGTCEEVVNQITIGLYAEAYDAGVSMDTSNFSTLIPSTSLDSSWLNFNGVITDETFLAAIAGKKIKLSLKVDSACVPVCILIDRIELNRKCSQVDTNNIFVTQSPSFNLEKIVDNKKSWVSKDETHDRDFDLSLRETEYDLNHHKLALNTKEIDLNISPARAVETDVWCYINDNPCILTGVTQECILYTADTITGCTIFVTTQDSEIYSYDLETNTSTLLTTYGFSPSGDIASSSDKVWVTEVSFTRFLHEYDIVGTGITFNRTIYLSNVVDSTGMAAIDNNTLIMGSGNIYEVNISGLSATTNLLFAIPGGAVQGDIVYIQETNTLLITAYDIDGDFLAEYEMDGTLVRRITLPFPNSYGIIVNNGVYYITTYEGDVWRYNPLSDDFLFIQNMGLPVFGTSQAPNCYSNIEVDYSEACCGDHISFDELLTTPLDTISTIEEFERIITSELIDVKSRKTLSSYPTLKALYDRYMNSTDFCDTQSSRFTYRSMDAFAGLIGTYWVDLIEQVIPATTIWGSTYVYGNTIFDKQKFEYKTHSLFTCVDSSATTIGYDSGVDVTNTIYTFDDSGNTFTTVVQCSGVAAKQWHCGSEFIGTVTVIGGESQANPCEMDAVMTASASDTRPVTVSECELGVSITTTPTGTGNTGTATANYTGAILPVTYLWSTGETTQTITGLGIGSYAVTITDAICCEASTKCQIDDAQP